MSAVSKFVPNAAIAAKPGYLTSEFWLGLVPVIVILLSAVGVHLDSGAATSVVVAVTGAVAAVYAAARTVLKIYRLKFHPSVVAVPVDSTD